MHARAAVFDLYGDHLGERGHWAPIAGIVRLLGTCHITQPTVRTAVSRLVREGWLERAERQGLRGYAATARARDRLAEARARIYRTDVAPWDGRWHVVVTERITDRTGRTRVGAALAYLGYARLGPETWIAPGPNPELAATLHAEDVGHTEFHAEHPGPGHALAASLWDLDELARSYREFVADTLRLRQELPAELPALPCEQAFAVRTALVHRWRKFLFTDPGLPGEVLPADWPGQEAADLFADTAAALLPGARIFVDECITWSPTLRSAEA